MHLETSSSDRPKMVTYTETQTVPSYMSVKFTRRTLRMPSFTRATHAQPSLSKFTMAGLKFWRADLLTRDDPGGTKFSHFPPKQNYQTHTLFDIRANANNINPTDKMNVVLTLIGLPQTVSCWRYTPTPKQDRFQDLLKAIFPTSCTQIYPNKINIIFIPTYLNC